MRIFSPALKTSVENLMFDDVIPKSASAAWAETGKNNRQNIIGNKYLNIIPV